MRPYTRLAVSVLLVRMGFEIADTSSVPMCVYRFGADLWSGVGLEGAYPLMDMFGILPSVTVR